MGTSPQTARRKAAAKKAGVKPKAAKKPTTKKSSAKKAPTTETSGPASVRGAKAPSATPPAPVRKA